MKTDNSLYLNITIIPMDSRSKITYQNIMLLKDWLDDRKSCGYFYLLNNP